MVPKSLMHNLRTWVKRIIVETTKPITEGVRRDAIGSNPVSLWLRKKLEKISIRRMIGVNLAGFVFFSAVIVPGANDALSTIETSMMKPGQPVIDVVPTESTFQWPISRFTLSQRFAVYHPAIDLATASGIPVYPVSDGKVVWVNYSSLGYGNHILIEDNRQIQSLYAHLSKILVQAGETVTKKTQIGQVGATGWATGNHLHFEIYEHSTPVNPLEVLPELK